MAEFEIFLSWSQPSSHKAAEAFKLWLPTVLPGVKPWLSNQDIMKGKPWFASISAQLPRCSACLICVTPENVNSAWLYYEAGAIAHAIPDAMICSYLIGVKPGELGRTPLGQYQATVFDKEDSWLLIRDLNKCLRPPHHESMLRGHFETHWPTLEAKLNGIPLPALQVPAPKEPSLTDEAKNILVEAGHDKDGHIMATHTSHGFHLSTNDKEICDRENPRVEAAYRAALDFLVRHGFLRDPKGKGEVMYLTDSGWKLSDELRKNATAPNS